MSEENSIDENPYIKPENYYAGYQESVDKLKDNPEIVQFDKLCHMVLKTPDGEALMNEIDKRYLIPSLASPAGANYKTMAIYTEGFKEAFRMLKACVMSHEQRIKAEIGK
jgi:hypothetical protein